MKTTKEQREMFRLRALELYGTDAWPDVSWTAPLCDDADEAERLEAENTKLRKRLEAFETCVKRLYHDAID